MKAAATTFILTAVVLANSHADVVLNINFQQEKDLLSIRQLIRKYNGRTWKLNKHSIEVQVPDPAVKDFMSKFNATVIVRNAKKQLQKSMMENEAVKMRVKRRRAFGSVTQYFARYDEIVKWMKGLEKSNNFVSVKPIGLTYQKKQMYVIKIGLPGKAKKGSVFITGGFHAREWLGVSSTVYTIHKLIREVHYPKIRTLLSRFDFYILPVSNPDGYEYTFLSSETRMWRKTMRPTGSCVGVDPNRNFDIDFANARVGPKPCDDDYAGTKSFSEFNVQNIRDFANKIQNKIQLYFDVHAYSQMILLPLAYDHKKNYARSEEVKRIGTLMKKAIKSVNNRTYVMGAPGDLLYDASGSSIDWFFEKLHVPYTYGFEVYPIHKEGHNGFIEVSTKDIPTTGNEIYKAIVTAAQNIRV